MRFSPIVLLCCALVLLIALPTWFAISGNMLLKESIVASKKPLLELRGFRYTTVDEQGRSLEVLGKFGYHFPDFDVVEGLFFRGVLGTDMQSLSCKTMQHTSGVTKLFGNVSYERGDGTRLQASQAQFDKQKNTLEAADGFVLSSRHASVQGDRMSYSIANRTASAENIKAVIQNPDGKKITTRTKK